MTKQALLASCQSSDPDTDLPIRDELVAMSEAATYVISRLLPASHSGDMGTLIPACGVLSDIVESLRVLINTELLLRTDTMHRYGLF